MTDKVALVTGASKGMGFSIAKNFAEAGMKVCMVARDEQRLLSAKNEILTTIPTAEVLIISADVSEESSPATVVKKCQEAFGKVDILINNAGGPPPGSFMDFNEEDWSKAIQQNLMSAIRFCVQVTPMMIKSRWGRIVSILSTAAKEPTAAMVLSATARAGLAAFTKAAALELASHQITVNAILPGGVLTDRVYALLEKQVPDGNPEKLQEIVDDAAKAIPIQRYADPKEIADVVSFLVSHRAAYITGTNLAVDGGLTKGAF